MAARNELPSLNGIRAVCIALVVGCHARVGVGFPARLFRSSAYVFDGNLGVTVFFVLSGFLITYLMAREESRTGAVSLTAFYIRRFLRILPVYFAFLIALFVLTLTTGLSISGCRWVTAITFTKNYSCRGWVEGHLWTLSVEEQFYLLWPAIFALVTRNGRLAFAGVLVLAAPLFRVYLYKANFGLYLFSFMTNMDALMIGSVVGLAYHRRPESVRTILAAWPTLGRAAAALLIYGVLVLRLNLRLAPLTVLFGTTIQSVGAAYLIASFAIIEGGLMYRALNCRPMRYLGLLSYSIYIWQQPFFSEPKIFGVETNVWLTFPCNVFGALAVAALSYHALEMPLAGLRRHFRPLNETLTPAAWPPAPAKP